MLSLEQLLSDFQRARSDFEKVSKDLPRIIGVESKKAAKNNFALQGYLGPSGLEKWEVRKPATNAAYDKGKTRDLKTGKLSKYRSGKNANFKGSVFSSSKPILEQTMDLYNSIDYKIAGGYVFVGVNLALVPYARAHNEGLHHEPKRQFLPFGNQQIPAHWVANINKKLDFETQKALGKFKI